MLVEMATGTGKTRMAAALLKRLFEAHWVTRALFVVDRNPLAIQAEDAFAEHLPHLPCYRVPRIGRRFQDEKRITIVTLQTLVNEYEKYSSGYFDMIVIDECHRSIYGQWRRALDHFDAIKIGLTATPCVMQDARMSTTKTARQSETRCASSRFNARPIAIAVRGHRRRASGPLRDLSGHDGAHGGHGRLLRWRAAKSIGTLWTKRRARSLKPYSPTTTR